MWAQWWRPDAEQVTAVEHASREMMRACVDAAGRCGTCHGDLATAGLNLLSYESLMAGSENGVVVIPGDSAGSVLFQVQSEGGHLGNFTNEELELIQQWIDAGAPDN